ncbi:MAG: GGDEF domain-containing protein [Gammaproteobacteria bacterium]|nr:GGDEF domain-containing protein [Gammaproteobacteria bacterium]
MENGRPKTDDSRDREGSALPGANAERRQGADRRGAIRRSDEHARQPTWEEQRAQFLTRYLFWALGLAYFNFNPEPLQRGVTDAVTINVVLDLYVLLVTVYFWRARQLLYSPVRWRLAMWTDIMAVSYAVIADPVVISPAYLVYIMVILGNGMRYGLRFFQEAVIGCFALGGLTLLLQYPDLRDVITLHTVFFALFGGIIILYAYALTQSIERARRQLERERSTDMLTGLLNRRALYERAEELFQRLERGDRPLVVVFADIDRFKRVNDTHGHQVGDRVLTEIAQLLNTSVRGTDVVGRFGGDEFILLLPDTVLDGGTTVAQRLQQILADWTRARQLDLSLSIGLGQAPQHGRDLKSVLERVDQAMYRSKLGRGQGGILRVGEVLPA